MEGGEGMGVWQPGRGDTPGVVGTSVSLVVVLNISERRINK